MSGRRPLGVCLMVALPLLAAPAARAQQTASDSALAVAREYLTAVRDRRLRDAAALVHPEELERLRRQLRPLMTDEQTRRLVAELVGVDSLAQFDQLSGADLFVAFAGRQSAVAERTEHYEVIGAVAEADSLRHAVVRAMQQRTSGVRASQMMVVTLRRAAAGWRLNLGVQLGGLAALTRNSGD